MAGKKPRGLSPEDSAIWERVTQSTRALHPNKKPQKTSLTQPKSPEPAKKTKTIPPFKIGEAVREKDTKTPATAVYTKPALQIHRRDFSRLVRGKLKPEGKIDLHGMTLAQAHPALIGYLMRAHNDGKRLVLVITGKGRDRDDGSLIPVSRRLLRNQVPLWLEQAPLKSIVLQVTQAHRSHGGGGAYYVYLRK